MAAVVAAAPCRALEVPGTAGRLELRGWVDANVVLDTATGPYQHPWGRAMLEADARLAERLSLALAVRAHAGGPYRDAAFGLNGFDDAFQNWSPAFDVREASLGWRLRDADLRAGIQRFAWGRLDGIPPTDVLNPRDYHDPIVEESEERKIGVPALSGTYYAALSGTGALSRLDVQLVYVPIAVPPRLALEQERWFPSSTAPASRLTRRSLRPIDPGIGFGVPVEFGTADDAPPRTFGDGAVGVRVGGTWRGADWDLYYYGGPETGPDARLEALVVAAGGGFRAISALVQEHDTIHMFGADSALVWGPVSLRAEAAYFLGRPYLRRGSDVVAESIEGLGTLERIAAIIAARGRLRVPLPPLFADRDAVEWGIGADGVWRGIRPLVQVTQIVLADDAPRLLIGEPETRVTTQVRKAVFHERVDLEWRSVYAVERGGWFVLPRIAYLPRDDVRLRVGYLVVGGSPHSMIGQFKRNDEVVLDVRWSF